MPAYRDRLLSAFLFLLLSTSTFAMDADTLIEDLVPPQKSPRALNSEDVDLKSNTPLPLNSPEADLNGDGVEDHVVSGIYNLPGQGPRYFLLVGTERLDPRRSEELYFREFPQPVFVYARGTTGEGDPGDQSFSISFCLDCDQGFDFYWEKHEKKFISKPWSPKIRRLTKLVIHEAPQVPIEQVDEALKIVGPLKDVSEFVAKLKKQKKELKTRVEPVPGEGTGNHVVVKIFEKRPKEEVLYDAITVDLKLKKVIARKSKKKF